MSDLFAEAVAHHQAGRMTEATLMYQRVPAGDPRHGDALFLLAGFDIHSGRLDAAVEKLTRATTLDPNNAAYHSNLGEAYRRMRRYPEAASAFVKAMSLKPDLAEVTFNLALLLEQAGEMEGAAACFERAQELKADLPNVAHRLEVARKAARRKVKRSAALRRATAGTFFTLASQDQARGHTDRALALCRRSLELEPGFAPALHMLGVMLSGHTEQLDEAAVAFRKAIEIDPGLFEAYGNLGYTLATAGRMDEGVEAIKHCGVLASAPMGHSTLIFLMPFQAGTDAASILAEAREWDRLHGQPLATAVRPHDNDRSPDRRLRVGYVSPDFHNHCQSFFTLPLFSNHDRERFEIFAYSSVPVPDPVTAAISLHVDQWRTVFGVDDATVAERVRADRIDVLVDLTMHMSHGRPGLFARKPAPVQVCWLAYPGTTGLSAMDYRLTDPHLDPPGSDTGVYSEETVRLPDTFWCFDPHVTEPAVGPLPARASGCVTFGCLNNFLKVNAGVIDVWARVLLAVEGSRLVLMAPLGEARERTLQAFVSRGVARERVELVGRRSRRDYLASYRELDLGLDTFPYNGHTTSLDSLWMGVPVVTLVGDTIVGRAGLCQAMNLGMPELIAATPDEYVRVAVEWSRDLDRLERVRAGLRARIEASPLMDAPRFARNIEAAYRQMWTRWCAK